jgi:hypothetical protein
MGRPAPEMDEDAAGRNAGFHRAFYGTDGTGRGAL